MLQQEFFSEIMQYKELRICVYQKYAIMRWSCPYIELKNFMCKLQIEKFGGR